MQSIRSHRTHSMRIKGRLGFTLIAQVCIAAILFATIANVWAQNMKPMGHRDHADQAAPSTQLALRGLDGKMLTLTPADFAALPHKSLQVFNSHTKANETYSGVLVSELLKQLGSPQGESVMGKLFMTAVIAEGTDQYASLYALAETDPSIHTGEIIVADEIDGHPLGKEGAFKMISSEDRRPARWVRNLTRISVVAVQP